MAQTLANGEKKNLWFVITASSVGTLIEWYDFYIFGSLATILSAQFFPKDNPTAGILSTLAIFAAGFVFRPFGAIVFGWFGDIFGRKYTFLLTLILMGGATFAIGLVPNYESIGIFAPTLVLVLRLLQGLALGGEYGGAATYVAEHSPPDRRGFFTSFIQTTASLGFFVSIAVILLVRQSLTIEEFNEWGWRIPFLLSAILVLISIYIRLKMQESPLFAKIKSEGKVSKNPIKESFAKKENLKLVLLALFGATAGQGVVWYTGQFYAMNFIEITCKVEYVQTRYILAIALLIGTPLFIYFGWLSDRIGRKLIMMMGMFLAVVMYRPIYRYMLEVSSLKDQKEISEQQVISKHTSISDDGTTISRREAIVQYSGGNSVKETTTETSGKASDLTTTTKKEVILGRTNYWTMIILVVIQIVFVTMVYGPIAAFLVELFPTRIRYTSMSLPYHIGNGVFGGLTPFIATYLYEQSKDPVKNPGGDPFAGLWYPIIVAGVCFLIGMIYLDNKKKNEVME
jgi:MFS family permease